MMIFFAGIATSRQALPPGDTICNSETFFHFETLFTQLRDNLPPRDMIFCHLETWHVFSESASGGFWDCEPSAPTGQIRICSCEPSKKSVETLWAVFSV